MIGASISLKRPFQLLDTSMPTSATLNNNEVVRLVDAHVDRNRAGIRRASGMAA
ncbi:MAG: hypothetical protein ACRD2Z_12760 [Thermoanaerobaculia bacterium]